MRSRSAKHHHGAVAIIHAIANEGSVVRPGLQSYLGDETLFEAGPEDQETGGLGQGFWCQPLATNRGIRHLQADLDSQRHHSKRLIFGPLNERHGSHLKVACYFNRLS